MRTTTDVSNVLVEELDLPEQWGIHPYFRFRSQSEQEKMQELSWAER